jgi:uncharacterized protein (TIGR02147 family)
LEAILRGRLEKIDIYQYLDYIPLLNEWVELRRKREVFFSFQLLAEEMGVQSKAYFQNVLKGRTTFSKSAQKSISTLMKLDEKEEEYFFLLVAFKHSKKLQEKSELWMKILERYTGGEPGVPGRKLVNTQFDYLSHWYIPVVKEVLLSQTFDGNFAKLGRRLIPQISAAQARFAWKVLLELDIINASKNGEVTEKSQHIFIDSEVKSLAIRNFQKENANLAEQALQTINRDQRDISTISIGTTEQGFQRICDLIQQFQKEIVQIVEEEEKVERTYTLNVQLFPTSKVLVDKGSK